nr:hypothetical protein 1634Bnrm2_p139 [Cryptomonas sp.]
MYEKIYFDRKYRIPNKNLFEVSFLHKFLDSIYLGKDLFLFFNKKSCENFYPDFSNIFVLNCQFAGSLRSLSKRFIYFSDFKRKLTFLKNKEIMLGLFFFTKPNINNLFNANINDQNNFNFFWRKNINSKHFLCKKHTIWKTRIFLRCKKKKTRTMGKVESISFTRSETNYLNRIHFLKEYKNKIYKKKFFFDNIHLSKMKNHYIKKNRRLYYLKYKFKIFSNRFHGSRYSKYKIETKMLKLNDK